jgi:hypothetical protein
MKFNNLRRQILANLGHRWRKINNIRSFDLETIRSDFADIPEHDFLASIESLEEEGLIQLSHDCRTISLAHKGLDHLHIIHTDKKDEEIIIAEKLS